MNSGKSICDALKTIRRNIAKENGIDLHIPPCHYQGECSGTCPQCDHELQQLEAALARKLSLGKMATVAGLAIGLHATAQAASISNPAIPDSHQSRITTSAAETAAICKHDTTFAIRVRVVDTTTNEPIPEAEIFLLAGKQWLLAGTTNQQGFLSIHGGLVDHEYQLVAQKNYHFFDYHHTHFTCRPSTDGDTLLVAIDKKTGSFDPIVEIWSQDYDDFYIQPGEVQVTFDSHTPASHYQPPQVTLASHEQSASDDISSVQKETAEMVFEKTHSYIRNNSTNDMIGLKLVSADDLGAIPLALVRVWRRGKLISERFSNFNGVVQFNGLNRRKYTIEILSPYHPPYSVVIKAEPRTRPVFLHNVKVPN